MQCEIAGDSMFEKIINSSTLWLSLLMINTAVLVINIEQVDSMGMLISMVGIFLSARMYEKTRH